MQDMQYEAVEGCAAHAAAEERGAFIARTYAHLAGAIMAFVALVFGLMISPFTEVVATVLQFPYSWLGVMLGFVGVSYIADSWARSGASPAMQYAGLGLYVVAEAVIFVPLVMVTIAIGGDVASGVATLMQAAVITGVTFAGLTGFVFFTRKDFSFMRGILATVGCTAFGMVLCSVLFGFTLGTLFSAAMVVFAGGCILYKTSAILHHYRTDQHVSAALSLFASVALMFWYVIRILNAMRR